MLFMAIGSTCDVQYRCNVSSNAIKAYLVHSLHRLATSFCVTFFYSHFDVFICT